MSDDMGPDMAKDACDLPSQVEQLLPPSEPSFKALLQHCYKHRHAQCRGEGEQTQDVDNSRS